MKTTTTRAATQRSRPAFLAGKPSASRPPLPPLRHQPRHLLARQSMPPLDPHLVAMTQRSCVTGCARGFWRKKIRGEDVDGASMGWRSCVRTLRSCSSSIRGRRVRPLRLRWQGRRGDQKMSSSMRDRMQTIRRRRRQRQSQVTESTGTFGVVSWEVSRPSTKENPANEPPCSHHTSDLARRLPRSRPKQPRRPQSRHSSGHPRSAARAMLAASLCEQR